MSDDSSTAVAITLILNNIAQRLADKRSNLSDNGSGHLDNAEDYSDDLNGSDVDI